jgi:SsrA-binding protein
MKLITTNRKAFFDYDIDQTLEAGIVLTGDEVKSLRANLVSLAGTFATLTRGELFLLNCYIGLYSHAYSKQEEKVTRRTRKLLVKRRELDKLAGSIARKGMTLIPLKMYFNERGKVKVELGLARHKKAHMRKEELRERDIKRETRRELKGVI